MEGGPFVEAWVDQSTGLDTGSSDQVCGPSASPAQIALAKSKPFKTINAAISQVNQRAEFGPDPIHHPGIVHLEPGIYTPPVQSLPIVMLPFVHLQGSGARQCVIRGTATRNPNNPDDHLFGVGFPEDLDGNCGGGRICQRQVLLDYSFSLTFAERNIPPCHESSYSERVDGITFQGGDVQVYSSSECPSNGRISNCVFDMLDYSAGPSGQVNNVIGPEFGILFQHHDDGAHPAGVPYGFDIFNNSFIQGWKVPALAGGKLTARPTSVGIGDFFMNGDCDDEPDANGCFPCASPLVRVGKHNIQNNLFRSLSGASNLRFAFLGVNFDDTSVAGVPTNWFRDGAATSDQAGPYCSLLAGPGDSIPEPAAPYEDPAFVGEMLMSYSLATPPGPVFGIRVGRDWRILPTSPLIDMGIGPDASGIIAGGSRSYIEPSKEFNDCAYSAIDSFVFDGEGYGNRRVRGTAVDIGFDEFERMIQCAFGNESLGVSLAAQPCAGTPADPCYCIPVPGNNVDLYLFPDPAGQPGVAQFTGGQASCTTSNASSTLPGTIVPPIQVLPNLFQWNVNTLPTTTVNATQKTGYVPPDSPNHSYNFGSVSFPQLNANKYLHTVVRYMNVFTNLQSAFN